MMWKDVTAWDKDYNTSTLSLIQHKYSTSRQKDMDRRTHCTGQRAVEKRFMLCLGMKEVSNLLTFQGGIRGWNIQNDTDRDIVLTTTALVIPAVVNGPCFECLQEIWLTSMWRPADLSVIQAGKEKQVFFKIPTFQWLHIESKPRRGLSLESFENLKTHWTLFDFGFILSWRLTGRAVGEQDGKKVLDSIL